MAKSIFNPDIHNRQSIRLQGYDYSQPGAYFITICAYKQDCLFGEIVAGISELNDVGYIVHDQWIQLPERFPNLVLDEYVVMPNHIHGILWITDSTQDETEQPQVMSSRDESGQPQGLPVRRMNEGEFQGKREQKKVRAGFTPAQDGIGQSQEMFSRDESGQPQGLPVRNEKWNEGQTIGQMIGAYKSLVVHECLKIFNSRNETMGKIWKRNYYEHIIRDEKDYRRIAEYIQNNPLNWELDSLYKKTGNE